MKKYIQPSTEVIEMELATVVATSLTNGESVPFQSGTTEEMNAAGRRGSAWSDYETR